MAATNGFLHQNGNNGLTHPGSEAAESKGNATDKQKILEQLKSLKETARSETEDGELRFKVLMATRRIEHLINKK